MNKFSRNNSLAKLLIVVSLSIVPLIACPTTVQASVGPADPPKLVIDSGGNTRQIKNVIFTKDGSQLVSVGDDKLIRVWDLQTGKTVRAIRGQFTVCADCFVGYIALSPDEEYLAVGGDFPGGDAATRFAIQIYRFSTGELLQLLKGHRVKVTSLAFSPDGKQLASGSAHFDEKSHPVDFDSVRIWNRSAEGWAAAQKLRGHENSVSGLAFSPDRKWLVSGSFDTTLLLWDLAGKAEDGIPMKQPNQEIFCVAFSPDGSFIVSGGNGEVNLWNSKGVFIKKLVQQTAGVFSIAFSPDKDHLRVLVGSDNGVSTILSVPDGQVVSSFRKFDDKFKKFDDSVRAVGFSQDGRVVATSGGVNGEIALWEADSGKPYASGVLTGSGKTVWSVGFAKDGSRIAFGTKRTTLSPENYGPLEQVIHLKASSAPVEQVSMSVLNRVALAGAVKDETDYERALIRTKTEVYELRTNVGKTQKRKVGAILIDEPILLDRVLQVFKNGQKLRQIVRKFDNGRTHQSYSLTHDGSYIVSGGERGYLALYNTETGEEIHRFLGHTNDVWGVAVSPDDRYLVSGSSDQTVRLWDMKSGRNVLTIFVADDQEWVAYTPEGYYTSSSGGDKYFGWQVNRGASEPPEFYSGRQFQKELYRPDVIAEYLKTPDIQLAMSVADSARAPQVFAQQISATPKNLNVQKMLPPIIKILSPDRDNAVVQERMVRLRVSVVSETLPITEVNVSLNGLPRGTFSGDPNSPEESKKLDVEMLLKLEEGENYLYVVAANASASSKPEIRRIVFQPGAKELLPKKGARVVFDRDAETTFLAGASHEVLPVQFTTASYTPPSNQRFTSTVNEPLREGLESVFPSPTPTPTPAPAPTPAPSDPPVVLQIIAPEATVKDVNDENLSVSANAISIARPRMELKIFLNDSAEPLIGISRDQRIVIIQNFQITLRPGVNVLRFTASNGEDVQEKTMTINYHPPTTTRPNLIFLGIGISRYEKLRPNLRFADKDARDLGALLSTQGAETLMWSGMSDEPVKTSPPPEMAQRRLFEKVKVKLIADEDASRAQIIRGLTWVKDQTEFDNDVRIVLIAGHGGIADDDTYYFYSHFRDPKHDPDEDSISWSLFWKKLTRSNSNALLFVDTCHAGKASKDFIGNPDTTGVLFYSASTADETSVEDLTFQHGVFTQAILEGLRGEGDADADKNGKIDSRELENWVEKRVKELNSDQSPVIKRPAGLKKPIILSNVPVGTNP